MATAVLTPEDFAKLVKIDKVIIGEAVYEQSSELKDIWSKAIVLAYVAAASKREKQNIYEPSYGYTVRRKMAYMWIPILKLGAKLKSCVQQISISHTLLVKLLVT